MRRSCAALPLTIATDPYHVEKLQMMCATGFQWIYWSKQNAAFLRPPFPSPLESRPPPHPSTLAYLAVNGACTFTVTVRPMSRWRPTSWTAAGCAKPAQPVCAAFAIPAAPSSNSRQVTCGMEMKPAAGLACVCARGRVFFGTYSRNTFRNYSLVLIKN